MRIWRGQAGRGGRVSISLLARRAGWVTTDTLQACVSRSPCACLRVLKKVQTLSILYNSFCGVVLGGAQVYK